MIIMQVALVSCCWSIAASLDGPTSLIYHNSHYIRLQQFASPYHSLIESVDSICKDSAGMQYIIIQKEVSKSQKRLTTSLYSNIPLQAFIAMYHPSSSVFMINNMPSGAKSIAKVLNQKVVFFFFFSSSFSPSFLGDQDWL